MNHTNTIHSKGYGAPLVLTFALAAFYSGQGGAASTPFTSSTFAAVSSMDPFDAVSVMDPFARPNFMDPFNSEGHE